MDLGNIPAPVCQIGLESFLYKSSSELFPTSVGDSTSGTRHKDVKLVDAVEHYLRLSYQTSTGERIFTFDSNQTFGFAMLDII